MAITIDAIGGEGAAAGGSLSSFTIATGASLLVVGINLYNASGSPANVRRDGVAGSGGVALTLLGGENSVGVASNAQFYYEISPPSGSHWIYLPSTGTVWWLTLLGSDTTTPFGTVVTTGGTPFSNPESLAPSAGGSGCLIVDCLGENVAVPSPTKDASQTLIANSNDGANVQVSGSYKFAGPGSVTMTWSGTGIEGGAAAVAINPASGGGGGTPLVFRHSTFGKRTRR